MSKELVFFGKSTKSKTSLAAFVSQHNRADIKRLFCVAERGRPSPLRPLQESAIWVACFLAHAGEPTREILRCLLLSPCWQARWRDIKLHKVTLMWSGHWSLWQNANLWMCIPCCNWAIYLISCLCFLNLEFGIKNTLWQNTTVFLAAIAQWTWSAVCLFWIPETWNQKYVKFFHLDPC